MVAQSLDECRRQIERSQKLLRVWLSQCRVAVYVQNVRIPGSSFRTADRSASRSDCLRPSMMAVSNSPQSISGCASRKILSAPVSEATEPALEFRGLCEASPRSQDEASSD